MIDIHKYNCKEQGECYLTYRRRLAREREQAKNDRAIHQTNEDWLKEFEAARSLGAAIFRRT